MKKFIFCFIAFLVLVGIAFAEYPTIVHKSLVQTRYEIEQGCTFGSGTILYQQFVLTCYHLIKDRPGGTLLIRTFEGKEREVEILGFDEPNDLLFLKLKEPVDWQTSVLAERADWGEVIYYGGFPAFPLPIIRVDFLTLAKDGICLHPIYFGDSGGGVFNQRQELIGVIYRVYVFKSENGAASPSCIGYAVPLDVIAEFLFTLSE